MGIKLSLNLLLLIGVLSVSTTEQIGGNELQQKEEDPEVQAPVFLTFKRWEDRTFPPRLLYLLMKQRVLKDASSSTQPPPPQEESDNFLLASRSGFSSTKSRKVDPPISFDTSHPTPNDAYTIDKLNGPDPSGPILFNRFAERQGSPSRRQSPVFSTSGINHDFSPIHYPEDPSILDLRTGAPFIAGQNKYQHKKPSGGKGPKPAALSEPILRKNSTIYPEPKELAFNRPDSRKDEVLRTLDMSLDMIRISNWEESNALFSPFSICNVLSLLLLGSSGRTFQELARQLRRENELSEIDRDEFHRAFKGLLTKLDKGLGDGVSLSNANRIFVDQRFPLTPSYTEDVSKFYDSQVQPFDFGFQGDIFKKVVNSWVREETHDKIKSIVDGAPSPTTTMALLNAVYFAGNWETPFPEKITKMGKFNVGPGEQIPIKMMTNIITIPYLSTEKYRMVCIPYKGNKTGLFIFLPKASNGAKGLREVEDSLTPESLRNNIYSMANTNVALTIPKMRLESNGQIRDTLLALGLKTIFEPNQANFSRISETGGLYVSALHHRAIIDLNEKGTEAAAVSAALGDRIIGDVPVGFNANRPFLFAIYHLETNTVIFWGRAIRPTPLPE